MNGLGRQIDRVDPTLRTDDMGPPLAQGFGQPFREGGYEVGAPRGADDGFQSLFPPAEKPVAERLSEEELEQEEIEEDEHGIEQEHGP
jgi:hypothetical protein